MFKSIIKTTALTAILVLLAPAANAQDLLARQAPVDKKMRAVDSIAIQRLLQTEELEDPAAELYPNWEDSQINLYGSVNLPDEYKIDLRGFCMPTTNRIVTSNYGYRPRFHRQHKGLDINANKGDTIRAAFDGKVRVVDFQPKGYGNVVVIRHPNGLETVYGHLSKHLTKREAVVKAGDPIGLAGNTGFSFGTHLHFETRLLGEYIDPAKLFDFANQDVVSDFYVFHKNSYEYDGRLATQLRGANGRNGYNPADVNSPNMGKSRETASNSGSTRYHKVKKGETLSAIARKHGTTVKALCRLNRISTSVRLRPGQILKYN